MATTTTLGAIERRRALLDALRASGSLRLEEAAAELGVSVMTVRRDVLQLDREGLARQVRGGAVLLEGPRPFGVRRTAASAAKSTIAQKALALVPTLGAIALDASSTVGYLAEALSEGRGRLTAVTNSSDTLAALGAAGGVTAILTGGEVEDITGSFVGPVAERSAASFHYSHFFTSATGAHPGSGTSEVSLRESEVKRSFREASASTVLCLDSGKLGQRAMAPALTWPEISVLITDLDPADPRLEPYRDLADIL